MSDLVVIPISLATANEFVSENHRHHDYVVGHRFSLGLISDKGLVGVCIVGRPVARGFDSDTIAEVTRLCLLDGVKNGCSKLYSAAARACKEMGFLKIITYILDSESGVSLSASGWKEEERIKGRSWDCESRPRVDRHPTCDKIRYSRILNKSNSIRGLYNGREGVIDIDALLED